MRHFANVNFSLTKICWRTGLFCSVSFDFFEVAQDQNLGSGSGADLPDKKTGKFHQLQLWFCWNCVGFNWGLDYILQASVKAWLCFSSKGWETLEGGQRYWGEIDLFKQRKEIDWNTFDQWLLTKNNRNTLLCFVLVDCVTQLKLYNFDKLSSPLLCCVSVSEWDVRHRCHPTKSPLFPIYTGIKALYWLCTN